MKITIFLLSALYAVSVQAVTIDTVHIGDPKNLPDMRYNLDQVPGGIGSVSKSFDIGKSEVTNAQYVDFLNAVAVTDPYELFSVHMEGSPRGGIVRFGLPGSYSYAVKPPGKNGTYSYANKPVIYVSVADAMRFANWLNNGQPHGAQNSDTTEDGAYTLNGAYTNEELGDFPRNPNARWVLPSEDEWYKAAYYNPVSRNYVDYPNGSNIAPTNDPPTEDTGNSANFYDLNYTVGTSPYTTEDGTYTLTEVAAYTQSTSYYGTFDQAGNVFEWNETTVPSFYVSRISRGGAWDEGVNGTRASFRSYFFPADERDDVGFRVASVPEPSSSWCVLIGLVTTASLWRTRA